MSLKGEQRGRYLELCGYGNAGRYITFKEEYREKSNNKIYGQKDMHMLVRRTQCL
jgi:hypothetical protein